jgi:site-specific recombinase XerC
MLVFTIRAALELYLAQLRANGRSPHTIAQARRHVLLLASYLPEHKVHEVEHEDVARFFCSPFATCTAKGVRKKATSLNALRSSIATYFTHMHRAGYIASDPGRLLRRARVGPSLPRGLSPDERERLLAALAAGTGRAAERDRVLFELMLGTGIRLGSALGLDIHDIEPGQGTLELRRTKGDAPQRVYVPDAIMKRLVALVARPRGEPVFVGPGGERLGARQVHRRLRTWCAKAGIERRVSPHSLRHTFALGLYEKTGDVLLVQAALNHRSIQSTTIYARASGERVRAAVCGG